jgi:hypothetical protein
MHFEVPKARLHSLKEFATHYLMIVLSILTALGLEQWIEHVHHEHAADFANRQIQTELSENLEEIRRVEKQNQADFLPLTQLDELVTGDVRAGLAVATINQHIQAHKNQFKLSISWPVFASQAWDVAVANQSATWIDVGQLRDYSAAYAQQRDASEWLSQEGTIMLSAPRMLELRTRLDLGQNVDPMDFLIVLRQMVTTTKEAQSHLSQLEPPLTRALQHGKGMAAP